MLNELFFNSDGPNRCVEDRYKRFLLRKQNNMYYLLMYIGIGIIILRRRHRDKSKLVKCVMK